MWGWAKAAQRLIPVPSAEPDQGIQGLAEAMWDPIWAYRGWPRPAGLDPGV